MRKEAAEWPASPAGPARAASAASAECGAVDLIGTLWATRIGLDSGAEVSGGRLGHPSPLLATGCLTDCCTIACRSLVDDEDPEA